MDSAKTIETIQNMTFCVIDLETTGGNHKNDKIIEIGLVKIEKLEITDSTSFLVNPEIPIPDFIQRLTSITMGDVAEAPKIEEIIDEVLNFMGDTVLIAHNTSFDIPFFNSVLTRLNRPKLTNPKLCTNLMTKYLIPNLLNSNLNYMSKIFGIDHKKAHRALDDAQATACLFLKYLSIFINKKISKINHLYYPRNRYELDRRDIRRDEFKLATFQTTLSKLTTPYLLTLKGENGVILFSLPCQNSAGNLKFIQNNIEKYPWETATIRLYGTFYETIIQFNGFYNKLDPKVRSEIIAYFEKEFSFKTSRINEEEESFPNDFIIINHLVPEQLVIYPLKALHSGSALVFRYPGHKKKLLQYIQSKSLRLKKNRMKKVFFHKHLCELLKQYARSTPQKHLTFDRKEVNDQNAFFEKIDAFLVTNPNPHSYPKEYL